MPDTTPPVTPLTTPDLELKSYCEDRDFRAEGKPEPNSRSQVLIYHHEDKKWWIKVNFQGTVSSFPHAEPEQVKSKRERWKEFQQFVMLIDFHSLALLDDTVTELILSEDPRTTEPINIHREPEDTNRFAKLIKNLRFHIREPLRRNSNLGCGSFNWRKCSQPVDSIWENLSVEIWSVQSPAIVDGSARAIGWRTLNPPSLFTPLYADLSHRKSATSHKGWLRGQLRKQRAILPRSSTTWTLRRIISPFLGIYKLLYRNHNSISWRGGSYKNKSRLIVC